MEFTHFVGLITLVLNMFLQISPIPGMIEGFRKNEIKSLTIGYFMTGINVLNKSYDLFLFIAII